MLNRILSKIKFSLSLRGAKRRSNLSGFSLIELMVAVVILALAIFGIFQAYSTGFMGMADARDRTVATNYLRQAIEDFKNMDFEQVKSTPITIIPDTKFSRGTYVLHLEETAIDKVVTLKKVIVQVRWMDRKGNIKTEKASTTIYNKPATSEVGEGAVELILYAQSYYTILPEHEVSLIAEIKDENGNIFDWNGDIDFSVITVPANEPPVGSITTTQPSPATNGVANCIFTAVTGENVEGIERIQASAIVGGVELTDTVNIRVTTGPVGIIIEPATEDDKILPAGETSKINLTVVKADYSTPIEYNSPITLSTDIGSPGTLSITTIPSVPTDGTNFNLISNGTPGIVEVTASAPDLDIGYTEITFTGEPASILFTPEKKSIYPGEDIDIKVTIVDVNNVPVGYNGTVNLTVLPNYGSFNSDSLIFTGQSSLDTALFTANSDAPPGEIITLQANSGSLSGSVEITILSLLTPYYLDIFAYPLSVNLDGGENSTKVTAKIYDDSGSEIVTTYNTPITFSAKIGEDDFGTFSNNNVIPINGEAEVDLTSDSPGTAIITAFSDDLVLRPEEGNEVIFYNPANHIELSADPLSIEADGHENSIITATVCDYYGNRVANYGSDPSNSIILYTTTGIFIYYNEEYPESIEINEFDEGQVIVALSSTASGTATVTAESGDSLLTDNGSISIELTGDVPTVLTLGDVTNWDDYFISFDINVTESSFILDEIRVEWNNSSAPLDLIIIKSPSTEEGLTIPTGVSDSPSTLTEVGKTIFKDVTSNIGLSFANGVSKMKQKDITVTFTEDDGTTTHVVSFKVPNM